MYKFNLHLKVSQSEHSVSTRSWNLKLSNCIICSKYINWKHGIYNDSGLLKNTIILLVVSFTIRNNLRNVIVSKEKSNVSEIGNIDRTLKTMYA